jgi:hypothetical protein
MAFEGLAEPSSRRNRAVGMRGGVGGLAKMELQKRRIGMGKPNGNTMKRPKY